MNDAISKIHSDTRLANFIEASRTPLRIACNTDSRFPLIVPLWFLFDGQAFWCVTHKDAKLLTHLRKDARVGFEIANNEPPYAGARGHGEVEIIPAKGAEILPRLLSRYFIREESRLARWLLSRSEDEVAIRLNPVYINGWDYQQRMQDAREF
ncbi:MAG TPA: pyridoxamine 5'-phosphate oxidase family protein [Pseudomonadales bacterium]|nr:pyridoxamine 5'-phosphate oxidase family protein [Pseudomonadales bacterium]